MMKCPDPAKFGVFVGVAVAWLASAATGWAQEPYRLATGDTLSFSVLQFPHLTRDIPIGIDGMVFLPMIGSVDAHGRTLEEIRFDVAQKLRLEPVRVQNRPDSDIWQTLQPSEVVIDVSEYRPVYVSGAVANPGAIIFRPGMTVRQAIAQAGGIGISGEVDELRLLDVQTRREDLASRIASAKMRVDLLRKDLQQVVSQGTKNTPTTSDPVAQTAELAGAGDAWLEAREALRDSVRTQLESSHSQMSDRLEVLEGLQEINEQTVQLREDELARATDLRERGIGREDAVNDAREDMLQASSRSLDTANELMRLKELLTETENLMTSTQYEARVELIGQIEEALVELVRTEKQLAVLDRGLGVSGGGPANDAYTVRSFGAGGSADPVIVDAGARLMPGDVIEVLLNGEDGS